MWLVEAARQTPLWVWALLAFLWYRGLRALRGGTVTLPRLAILPALFALWGLHGVLTIFGGSASSLLVWLFSMALGAGMGLARARRTLIAADHEKGLIRLPGSAATLLLMLATFIAKYAAAALLVANPAVRGSFWFLLLDAGVSGFVAGMFAGRLLGLWQTYKAAPHVALTA